MTSVHPFTKREEIANAITHGVGALLSVVALVLLIVFSSISGGSLLMVSAAVFGTTMLLLYVCSTLVHSFPKSKVKDLFEIFDHAAIFLFIAGTYTPIVLHVVSGALGWTLFGVVWGLALAGVTFKVFWTKKFMLASTLLYVLMGWMIVIAWNRLYEQMQTAGLVLLVAGGILYTVGSIFYLWRGFKYHHAVWHLFVIAGSICHFFVVLMYIIL